MSPSLLIRLIILKPVGNTCAGSFHAHMTGVWLPILSTGIGVLLPIAHNGTGVHTDAVGDALAMVEVDDHEQGS